MALAADLELGGWGGTGILGLQEPVWHWCGSGAGVCSDFRCLLHSPSPTGKVSLFTQGCPGSGEGR